jgi:hypothetical protein
MQCPVLSRVKFVLLSVKISLYKLNDFSTSTVLLTDVSGTFYILVTKLGFKYTA